MTAPKPQPRTPSERWANWTPPADSENRGAQASPQSLDGLIEQMDRTADSGVAMCHAQGKTAVYVSEDRRHIVEHPPHGPVTRRLRDQGSLRQP